MVAEFVAPAFEDPVDVVGVDVAAPRFPGDDGDVLTETRRVVEVDAAATRGVDHAVIGGDEQAGAGRQRPGELLDETIDHRELREPRRGLRPVDVPEGVDLADVAVDEAAIAGAHRGDDLGEQITVGGDPDEVAAAQHGTGEATALEGLRHDGGDVQARLAAAFEHRRMGLHGLRDEVVALVDRGSGEGPAEPVDRGLDLVDVRLIAGDAVETGREPRPEGGEADGRGRREAGTHRAPRCLRQVRGCFRVALQQFPTHSVDEQDDGVIDGGEIESVGLTGDPRGREHRRHQVGEGRLGVDVAQRQAHNPSMSHSPAPGVT